MYAFASNKHGIHPELEDADTESKRPPLRKAKPNPQASVGSPVPSAPGLGTYHFLCLVFFENGK